MAADPFVGKVTSLDIFTAENGTSENEFVIKTGVDDINELGKVVKFNGQSVLNVWKSEYANYINGSGDGNHVGGSPSSAVKLLHRQSKSEKLTISKYGWKPVLSDYENCNGKRYLTVS
ncbi:unnamed protein product [Trichobilharzia szidati]|nr:unnamed protein product [Trichobilharzia szidati]